MRYESALNPFPPLTVIVALVVLVLCDQLILLGVAVFLSNTASDPLLNPLQYLAQEHPLSTAVCGSVGLHGFLLEEVVSYRTKFLPFEEHSLKEVLGKFFGHRDWVLCAQFPDWITVTYIIDLGGYVEAVILGTAESKKKGGRPILSNHALNLTVALKPVLF